MCPDLWEKYVSAMAITVTLGSILLYFYRFHFAMGVFSHLYIDLRCGPSGYPEPLLYVNYICCMDDMYLVYPSQTLGNRIPFLPRYPTCLIAFILHQPEPTTRRRRHRFLQYIPFPTKPFAMIRTDRDLWHTPF